MKDMAAQILHILPGMGYQDLLDCTGREFRDWHERAVKTWAAVKGLDL